LLIAAPCRQDNDPAGEAPELTRLAHDAVSLPDSNAAALLPILGRQPHAGKMFAVDDAAAEAIRIAFKRGGELSAVAELRRHFPLITDNEDARRCVRAIASWNPVPPAKPIRRRHRVPCRDG
jgi:hypothetical protein